MSLWNLLWFVPLALAVVGFVAWARWGAYKRYREGKEIDAEYHRRGEAPPWAPPAPWTAHHPSGTDEH